MVGRNLLTTPCVRLEDDSSREAGALRLALHPRFKSNHELYFFYTHAPPHESRVSSFVVANNRCTQKNDIVTGLNATSGYHIGGQIEFVNGKLFVSTGEDHEPAQ